ncbi:alpha/beta fold hydrolase [Luteolibacter pohnpeiensis]|uniref:Alpha/beta fold hydrolase n=1 Tax=Luteolibacter pohnpeiensis TaxID=454153 RepID=A0A934VSY1_9BACT|nr:alpha/beta fold hydrolase [Luteolibacter pohnpeiensis]MBK1880912.1 alpha/beta fold hydrolase [Luteolibacter pohnpeiensis]
MKCLPRITSVYLLVYLTFVAVSCNAPISYRIKSATIPGEITPSTTFDAAYREIDSGKAAIDSLDAAAHYLECIRLVRAKSLAGDQTATALENYATARLVEALQTDDSIHLQQSITLPSALKPWILAVKLEKNGITHKRKYLPADTVEFTGTYAEHHATRAGIGAPLIAISQEDPDFRNNYGTHRSHTALTAIIRFTGQRPALLEFHDPVEERLISLNGHSVQLAANFTAPAALLLSVDRPDKLGLIRLLNPQKYSATARISRLQPYDPKRIPVLLVHGLQDSPASWAPLYFTLLEDPQIRDHFQFWVFSYPSGYPYPYSASLLRNELDGISKVFPDHQKIVLIGHSMGGVISRLMVTDAGETIFRNLLGHGPDEIKIRGTSRQILIDSYVFNHRTDIGRVVFISTPHQGSEIASNWIGRISTRLVRLPSFIQDTLVAVSSVVTADVSAIQLNRAPSSIDTLSPTNAFVHEINQLPIATGIPFHSIMGDRGKGGNFDHTKPISTDGVVPYWSSHLNGANSEKIVPSNHSAHQNSEGIEEVRRILKLHLKNLPPPSR